MKLRIQMTQMTVICANISRLLFDLSMAGVGLHHICMENELTASFCIRQWQYQKTVQLVENSGGKVISNVPASGSIIVKGILHRPVLILGGVIILLLALFLPTRLLFVTVSGNEHLSKREILDAAANCGVRFGAVRHEIRSENVKNQLLAELPELKWAGVNTSGCVAQISVQERTVLPYHNEISVVSSIVASCDGVIRDMTIRNGNPLCRVGQAVKKGQLLVSGYSDCGLCIYGTRADAEIYAQTNHTLNITMLTKGVKTDHKTERRRKFGLIFGKKRINFYKGSGISDTTCVRMYREYPLTLPGDFHLPVSLFVQEEISGSSTPMIANSAKAKNVLHQTALTYLESQMIAGKVIQGNCQVTELDGATHMLGQYHCDEMISQTRNEETVNNYEQTD